MALQILTFHQMLAAGRLVDDGERSQQLPFDQRMLAALLGQQSSGKHGAESFGTRTLSILEDLASVFG